MASTRTVETNYVEDAWRLGQHRSFGERGWHGQWEEKQPPTVFCVNLCAFRFHDGFGPLPRLGVGKVVFVERQPVNVRRFTSCAFRFYTCPDPAPSMCRPHPAHVPTADLRMHCQLWATSAEVGPNLAKVGPRSGAGLLQASSVGGRFGSRA